MRKRNTKSIAVSPPARGNRSPAIESLLVEFSPRQSENDDLKVILQPFNERK